MIGAASGGGLASNDKLAAAAHLLIARMPPGDLAATKLNKILWFADCEFYRRHGRSLTGETDYVRRDFGPCPLRMAEVLAKLKRAKAIGETPRLVHNFTRREFTALSDPDPTIFDSEEIDILLGVALELAPLKAKAVMDMSHDDLWEATDPGGRMSVAAGSVRVMAPSPEVIEWAKGAFAA